LATSFDLSDNLEQRPVARQMLHSLLAYAENFAPKARLSPEDIERIIGRR